MGTLKKLKDKLFPAAVVKMGFRLSGRENTPAFQWVYPGLLRDLQLEDEVVEEYIAEHRHALEVTVRGGAGEE